MKCKIQSEIINAPKVLVVTSEVKYIGEGDDPAEDPYMKAYARALKEVYGNKMEATNQDSEWS